MVSRVPATVVSTRCLSPQANNMYILIFLLGIVLMVGGISEFSIRMVYGGWINEGALDTYLSKYYDHLELNSLGSHILRPSFSLGVDLPFLSTVGLSVTSKWYINDFGTIPRWSKWSAKLDAKAAELQVKEKQLSDL